MFPSVSLSIAAAEIFPWAAIYALFRKCLYKISTTQFAFMCAIIFSGAYGVYFYGSYFEFIRSFLAYLNPLLVFFAIYKTSKLEIIKLHKVVKFTLFFLYAIGIAQYSGIFSGSGIEVFLKFLIPRGEVNPLGGGRGVSLLSTEPSRAALEFVFIYATYRMLYLKNNNMHDLIFLIFLVFIIKSGVGLVFGLIFLTCLHPKIMLLAVIICLPLLASILVGIDNRGLQLIIKIMSISSITDIFHYLVSASGFRMVSVISSYYEGVVTIIGHGVGSWMESSVVAMNNAGFPPENIRYFSERSGELDSFGIRPTSYLANVSLDMGLFGIILFVAMIRRKISICLTLGKNHRAIVILFLFSIIFLGAVGNPIPWIALALAIRSHQFLDNRDFVVKSQLIEPFKSMTIGFLGGRY
jgi:hypothetical protein